MTKITIDLEPAVNTKVNYFQARNDLKTKGEAINNIIDLAIEDVDININKL